MELERYIQTLVESAEAAQRAHAEANAARKAETVQRLCDRTKPLPQRVRRVLAEIPPEVASQGIQLRAVAQMLRGKYRGHAHAGEVAAALRQLGWTRARNWSDSADGFRALWYPPNA